MDWSRIKSDGNKLFDSVWNSEYLHSNWSLQVSEHALDCVLLQTPMSPVYPQMLEHIQQLSMNGCPGPTTTNGTSPVLGPHNGFFGVDDFAPR